VGKVTGGEFDRRAHGPCMTTKTVGSRLLYWYILEERTALLFNEIYIGQVARALLGRLSSSDEATA
jgi:hypothetical protein